MMIAEEIEEIFKTEPNKPLEALVKAEQRLSEAFDETKGTCSPWLETIDTDKSAWPGIYGYFAAANMLESKGYFSASESLLLDWWNDWSQRQRTQKKQAYLAGIAFKLTEHYLRVGDKGAACRWALHTQAADILGKHSEGGGAARQWLPTLFGVSGNYLQELDKIAKGCLKEIEQTHRGDWSQAEGFPEEIVCRFAQTSGASFAMANAVSACEFPLSGAYFQALLSRVDADYKRGEEGKKGDALENLAVYLSLLLPGCLPLRKVEDEAGVSEHDIVVHNLCDAGNLASELLGRHFLVECKNWGQAVGTRDVGYFLYRIRLTHARFGIMFASAGISGEDITEAKELVRRAYHEDGNICVVTDHQDLDSLSKGETSFWWMLVEKIEALRFGKPSGHRKSSKASKF